MVEEVLLCEPIELGCRGIDLFNIIDNSISTNNLDWRNCISIWADGAKTVSGSRSGVRSLNLRTCSNGHVEALLNSPRGIGGS